MTHEPAHYAVTRELEDGLPVVTTPMPVWQMLLVRVARTFIQAFLGLGAVQAWMAGQLPAFEDLKMAVFYAAAISAFALLQNLLEFLMKIDVQYPAVRA